MKRMGILGLVWQHAPLLDSLLTGFRMAGFRPALYGPEEVRKSLVSAKAASLDGVDWSEVDDFQTESLLTRLEEESKHLELLIVDGVHRHTNQYLYFRPSCPCILNLHNVNKWLRPRLGMSRSCWSNAVLKHRILQQFDAVNVISRNLLDYLRRRTSYRGPVFCVPSALYEPRGEPNDGEDGDPNGKVTFTIPGAVGSFKRNYDEVLDALAQLKPELAARTRLYLLGPPLGESGRNAIKRCRQMNSEGWDIVCFDDFVSVPDFESYMEETDVLIGPVQPSMSRSIEREFYGQSKETAVIWDQIRRGVPAILPTHYHPNPSLAPATISYKGSSGLHRAMRRLIENRGDLRDLKSKAIRCSLEFTADKVAEYIERELLPQLRSARVLPSSRRVGLADWARWAWYQVPLRPNQLSDQPETITG